jgi:hypothetical protein
LNEISSFGQKFQGNLALTWTLTDAEKINASSRVGNQYPLGNGKIRVSSSAFGERGNKNFPWVET